MKSAMSGWATQVPPLTGSAAGNAAGSTSSGPYVMNPLSVLDPLAGTELSCQ